MSDEFTRDAQNRDNGLSASAYVALADVDPEVGVALLAVLKRARIAAYLAPSPGAALTEVLARDRLFVAAGERADARTIVASAMRTIRPVESDPAAPALTDALDYDAAATNAEFDALVANWQVDTVAAVKAAEKDLTREDSDWRARLEPADLEASDTADEEHYEPPPPPPLPRLALQTVGALVLLVASIAVLVFGGWLGLPDDIPLLLGIGGILVGAGILVMRLRERPDDEDDGAIV